MINCQKSALQRQLLLVGIVLIGCASCGPKFNIRPVDEALFTGYQPIDPVPADTVVVYDTCAKVMRACYWHDLPCAMKKTSLLPLQTAQVSMRKTEASGKISYLASAVSGEAGSYQVTMDYMKYRVEYVRGAEEAFIGSVWVGVGLRLSAHIVTKKAGLNLSGLGALGVQASQGNLSGDITVNVIGIDSKDVTNLIPLTSRIDETSIQSALEALASIKAKLWEGSELTPHYVAMVPAKSGGATQIRSQVSRYNKTTAGDCLRAFWKPDGATIDPAHEEAIRKWLSTHGQGSESGVITQFLRGAEFEVLRQQAVRDLKIQCE